MQIHFYRPSGKFRLLELILFFIMTTLLSIFTRAICISIGGCFDSLTIELVAILFFSFINCLCYTQALKWSKTRNPTIGVIGVALSCIIVLYFHFNMFLIQGLVIGTETFGSANIKHYITTFPALLWYTFRFPLSIPALFTGFRQIMYGENIVWVLIYILTNITLTLTYALSSIKQCGQVFDEKNGVWTKESLHDAQLLFFAHAEKDEILSGLSKNDLTLLTNRKYLTPNEKYVGQIVFHKSANKNTGWVSLVNVNPKKTSYSKEVFMPPFMIGMDQADALEEQLSLHSQK